MEVADGARARDVVLTLFDVVVAFGRRDEAHDYRGGIMRWWVWFRCIGERRLRCFETEAAAGRRRDSYVRSSLKIV